MPLETGPRARLYDADGHDTEVELTEGVTGRLGKRRLLWVDADREAGHDLATIGHLLDLEPGLVERLQASAGHADLTKYEDHLHLILESMEPAADGEAAVTRSIDVVGGRDWVLTVHDGRFPALERLDAVTEGETKLGALDAAGFVAAIADEVLTGYLRLVEDTEQEIDRLDERALRGRHGDDVLGDIVALRRRIGAIRRVLAPQRVAFAALARPEMALDEDFGQPWPGLTDRLDRTVDAVEGLRDLLVGTFDIHMGRAAKDANDVMKVLTLVSAVFLPAVVLAGVMGMNFPLPFFDVPDHFWIVVGAMLGLSLGILGVATRRHWL